jgi:hypothetical protein
MRAAYAELWPAMTGEGLPDWVVLDWGAPAATQRLAPGRGYIGWEQSVDDAWRAARRPRRPIPAGGAHEGRRPHEGRRQ